MWLWVVLVSTIFIIANKKQISSASIYAYRYIYIIQKNNQKSSDVENKINSAYCVSCGLRNRISSQFIWQKCTINMNVCTTCNIVILYEAIQKTIRNKKKFKRKYKFRHYDHCARSDKVPKSIHISHWHIYCV